MEAAKTFGVNDARQLMLRGSRHKTTGRGIFPRVPDGSPVAALYADLDLEGPATLYSFTVIHPGPKSGKPPFVLAYADFPQDTRVFASLACAPDRVRIGMAVEARATSANADAFVLVPVEEK